VGTKEVRLGIPFREDVRDRIYRRIRTVTKSVAKGEDEGGKRRQGSKVIDKRNNLAEAKFKASQGASKGRIDVYVVPRKAMEAVGDIQPWLPLCWRYLRLGRFLGVGCGCISRMCKSQHNVDYLPCSGRLTGGGLEWAVRRSGDGRRARRRGTCTIEGDAA
jgi:hypothetical protein